MESSDDLFLLIKSLTKTEKRYFKVNASKKQSAEDTNYLKLFDAIDKQKEFDEKEIIRQFQGDKFSKNLPFEKNYLYNRILKTLCNYYNSSSRDLLTDELLHFAEILYNKGLYSQSRKSIAKARSIIIEKEMFPQGVKMFRNRIYLSIQSLRTADKLESSLLDALADSRLMMEKLTNLYDFYELYIKFFVLVRKEGELIRSQAELQKFEEIVNHPLMENDSKALSVEAKALYFFMKYVYYYLKGDLNVAYSHYKTMTQELPVDHEYKFGHSDDMVRLSNFCEICLRMNKYDEVRSTLKEIEKLQIKSNIDKGKFFHRYYSLLLRLYVQTGEFERGMELVGIIESEIDNFRNIIHKSKIISINYFIAYTWFGAGDYKNALKWVNVILSDKSSDLRKDIQCFARILNLMIAYEKKDLFLIEHLVKSSQYYFTTREKLYKTESTVLSFFRKLSGTTDEDKSIELFNNLKTELDNLVKDPYENGVLQYLDMYSWVESKLENKSFAEVIKLKLTH